MKKIHLSPSCTHRDTNLDLLRIIATCFVIILHYNNTGSGNAFTYTAELGHHFQILLLFEVCAICAVNVFILITGYYQSTARSVTLAKPFVLLIELAVFTTLRYLLNCVLRTEAFTLPVFLKCLIPTNWYIIVYIALYMVSPYINALTNSITMKEFRILLIVLFGIFSCWAYWSDFANGLLGINLISPLGVNGSGDGYTFVNFVLLYLVGVYIRKIDLHKDKKRVLAISAATYFGTSILLFAQTRISFSATLSYCNPVVIIQSIAIFLFFCNINLKNKLINNLAKSSFGVYLLHSFYFRYINIEAQVTGKLILLPVYVVCVPTVIYLLSSIVYQIYKISLGKVVNQFASIFRKISYGINT